MNTHAAGTRLTALTEAWRAFLRDCPLAEPAMVSLEPTLSRISIQAGHHPDALDHLGELLLWAYTLDQVNARWWHTPDGSLHISSTAAPAPVWHSRSTAASPLITVPVSCS